MIKYYPFIIVVDKIDFLRDASFASAGPKWGGGSCCSLRQIIDDYKSGLLNTDVSKVEKRRLAKLRQRFLCRKVVAIWKQFAIERRPRVLTETEELQIRTIKKWHEKVNFIFYFSSTFPL